MLIDKKAIEEKFKSIKFSDLDSLLHHVISSIRYAQFCNEKIIKNPLYKIAYKTSHTHGAILEEYNKVGQQVEELSTLAKKPSREFKP